MSKREAEKRNAFRLEPFATARRSLSAADLLRLACLPRFITTARPRTGGTEMRPMRRVFYQTVFHRVEVNVARVSRKVPLIADRMP